MRKPSITLHVSPDGKLEVLAASDDAQVALDAFNDCNKAGDVYYCRKIEHDKRKVNVAAKKAAKKAAKSE
ncbi:MAG: hypothetical protein ACPIG6_06335 [Akkermansiaceae bacterium]